MRSKKNLGSEKGTCALSTHVGVHLNLRGVHFPAKKLEAIVPHCPQPTAVDGNVRPARHPRVEHVDVVPDDERPRKGDRNGTVDRHNIVDQVL